MGKIISNGIEYSGLMNVEGVFIDTNNVIQANTPFTTSVTYTATEDCCVYILFCGNNTSSGFIKIGNKEVGKLSRNDSTGIYVGQYFYVKKGQTISAETPNVQGLSYTVYGIQSGSNVISAENNYSMDEQVIGTWIDGSTLYQKTINLNLTLTNSWQNYFDLTGVNKIIDVNKIIVERDGEQISYVFSNNVLTSWIIRDGYIKFAVQGDLLSETWILKSITIQYTKTS